MGIMQSIKDYAKEHGISYESVRRQVNRYKEELGEHLIKENRTQYLDEEAVKFLDAKRKSNPVTVVEVEKDEELKKLREENKMLSLKVMQLQDDLLKEKDIVDALKEEKILLLEDAKRREVEKNQQAEPEKKSWIRRLFGI